jgi:DNA-binding NarL/FixJ family response regulator
MLMTVFLVVSNPVLRLGLRILLGAANMRVIGEVAGGDEVLLLVEAARVDLVIVCPNLSADGIEDVCGILIYRKFIANSSPSSTMSA